MHHQTKNGTIQSGSLVLPDFFGKGRDGMATALQAVLLSSTGLAFTYEGATLLVDVLNGKYGSFYQIPSQTADAVVGGEPPYDRVVGLLYSHLHPDHYDQQRNTAFLRHHPGVQTFFPTPDTPDQGELHMGPFSVRYGYLEHTPCDYAWAKHYVFWIAAGNLSVYLTTDARLVPEEHLAFWMADRRIMGFSTPCTSPIRRRAA